MIKLVIQNFPFVLCRRVTCKASRAHALADGGCAVECLSPAIPWNSFNRGKILVPLTRTSGSSYFFR